MYLHIPATISCNTQNTLLIFRRTSIFCDGGGDFLRALPTNNSLFCHPSSPSQSSFSFLGILIVVPLSPNSPLTFHGQERRFFLLFIYHSFSLLLHDSLFFQSFFPSYSFPALKYLLSLRFFLNSILFF